MAILLPDIYLMRMAEAPSIVDGVVVVVGKEVCMYLGYASRFVVQFNSVESHRKTFRGLRAEAAAASPTQAMPHR